MKAGGESTLIADFRHLTTVRGRLSEEATPPLLQMDEHVLFFFLKASSLLFLEYSYLQQLLLSSN